MKIKIYLAFFLGFLALSCAKEEIPPALNLAQLERLLTADSSKVWIPVASAAFPACALEDQYKFTLSKQQGQLSKLDIKISDTLCHEVSEDIKGLWKIDTIGRKSFINIYALDTSVYEIDFITASKLQLRDQNQEIKSFTVQQ